MNIQEKIDNFTLGEFNKWVELMTDEEPDLYSIFELFGRDFSKLTAIEMQETWSKIKIAKPQRGTLKAFYILRGRLFLVTLNPHRITAGQFLDLQWAISNGNNTEVIIATLLKEVKLPFRAKLAGIELRQFILDNFKISDAIALSGFFLKQSTGLLRLTKDWSMKKLVKMKKAQGHNQKPGSIGSK